MEALLTTMLLSVPYYFAIAIAIGVAVMGVDQGWKRPAFAGWGILAMLALAMAAGVVYLNSAESRVVAQSLVTVAAILLCAGASMFAFRLTARHRVELRAVAAGVAGLVAGPAAMAATVVASCIWIGRCL